MYTGHRAAPAALSTTGKGFFAMRVSRAQMAENRARILEEAGRLFRARGFEAVSLAEVMAAAGMTHGGFYGHFQSKDDLIAQTLAHGFAGKSAEPLDLQTYRRRFLSPQHCANPAEGCAITGLAVETGRQKPEARAAMTAGIRAQIDRLAAAQPAGTPEQRRRAAIGSWSAMVGAVILARSGDDPQLSAEILAEVGAWITEAEGKG